MAANLPCPFCGSDKLRGTHIRDGWSFGCVACGAAVHAFNPNAEATAIARWNDRAADADLLAAQHGERMSGPTPGPFVINSYEFRGFAGGHRYGEAGLFVQQVRGRMVAYFPMSQDAHERARDIDGEMRANANLFIAAQPALAALKELWLRTTAGTHEDRVAALTQAGDLLASLGALDEARDG